MLPTFAIISAVYGVEAYLPDLFRSLDAQTYDHSRIQVILVDDGSLDESGVLCEMWASTTDFKVTVLHQDNAGQAAARNTGLAALGSSDWVSFVDGDDFLADDYFARMAAFLQRNPNTALLSGHQTDYVEADPGRADRHPLRFRFEGGDQLVNINRFPRFFQLSAAAACFRLKRLRQIEEDYGFFDPRIRPNFEDGHLIARYLLTYPSPRIGFVASAVYHYRKRADGSSTLQTARTNPRRYTDVLEYGYLDVLERATARLGHVPEWLQNEIIYDLSWTFRSEDAMFGGTAALDTSTTERFHELVARCLAYVDRPVAEGFAVVGRPTAQREALAHGYDEKAWHWDSVVLDRADADRRLVMLVYHFTGEQPEEQILVRGNVVAPRHAKTRSFVYLRRALVHERILWVANDGDLTVRLDGQPTPLTPRWPQAPRMSLRPAEISKARPKDRRGPAIGPARRRRRRSGAPRSKPTPDAVRLRRAEKLARTSLVRGLFADAWVLMDRSNNAHDNAEHLFAYLRKHRRDINAWFVVERGSPDWERLRKAGYKRLVPHGSLLWMALCLHATHMISSHADRYVYEPFARPGGWSWRYIFLQHGVTKDDISRWLNSKTIDGIVTATKEEFASIAGDGSGYKFSTREVHLTGFPRHDRLTQLVSQEETSPRSRLLVIMPTWRQYLAGTERPGTGKRDRNAAFRDAPFTGAWRSLLSAPELRDAASDRGWQMLFMPHPNLEQYLDDFDIPDHVARATYGGTDVQGVLARAGLVVTDYSSIAFDAAFARKPVLYYQFDRDHVFGGGHTVRPGYFSYDRDGFGPVARTHPEAVRMAALLMQDEGVPRDPFAARIDSTFTAPRTGASRRVVDMIESLSSPLSPEELRTAIPTPQSPTISWGDDPVQDSGRRN